MKNLSFYSLLVALIIGLSTDNMEAHKSNKGCGSCERKSEEQECKPTCTELVERCVPAKKICHYECPVGSRQSSRENENGKKRSSARNGRKEGREMAGRNMEEKSSGY